MPRAQLWEKIDIDIQRAIDDLIVEIKADLRQAGFPAKGSAFPFGLHHDFYRVRIRLGGKKTKHGEVSSILNAWAHTRADKVDYARQAICGSVKSMLAKRPELAGKIPGSARSVMAAVSDGYDFLRWAKEAVSVSPEAFLHMEEVVDRDKLIDDLIDAVGDRGSRN